MTPPKTLCPISSALSFRAERGTSNKLFAKVPRHARQDFRCAHRVNFFVAGLARNFFRIFKVLNSLAMLAIKKKYVTDAKKRPVAVQIDIETFEKIEQLLEDYALGKLIEQNDPSDELSLEEAKAEYKGITKESK